MFVLFWMIRGSSSATAVDSSAESEVYKGQKLGRVVLIVVELPLLRMMALLLQPSAMMSKPVR